MSEFLGETPDGDEFVVATEEGVVIRPVIDAGRAERYRCPDGCHLIVVPEEGEPFSLPTEEINFGDGLTIYDFPVWPGEEGA